MRYFWLLVFLISFIVKADSGGFFVTNTPCGLCVLPASIPANTAAPSIVGATNVGQLLTVNQGTWTNIPASYTHQWTKSGTNITGATGLTYTPVSGDVGSLIAVIETASNSAGAGTPSTSASVGPIS